MKIKILLFILGLTLSSCGTVKVSVIPSLMCVLQNIEFTPKTQFSTPKNDFKTIVTFEGKAKTIETAILDGKSFLIKKYLQSPDTIFETTLYFNKWNNNVIVKGTAGYKRTFNN